MTEKILIVEDEPDILKLVEFNLKSAGYSTMRAMTGREALEKVRLEKPALIVLDLMLPDIRGTEVCAQLKADKRTASIPIVMLTARSEEVDRVVGFELGADDYITKPFSSRELTLRVRAILRRTNSKKSAAGEDEILRFGEITVDTGRHRVWVNDEEQQLTNLEFKLFTTFLKRRGRVQSRDTLLNDVWGLNAAVTTRTVDTHVKRLREKLGEAGRYIETVRGIGYRFQEEPGTSGASSGS
jgi:two-component system phosphate regulon response regulator PhoB